MRINNLKVVDVITLLFILLNTELVAREPGVDQSIVNDADLVVFGRIEAIEDKNSDQYSVENLKKMLGKELSVKYRVAIADVLKGNTPSSKDIEFIENYKVTNNRQDAMSNVPVGEAVIVFFERNDRGEYFIKDPMRSVIIVPFGSLSNSMQNGSIKDLLRKWVNYTLDAGRVKRASARRVAGYEQLGNTRSQAESIVNSHTNLAILQALTTARNLQFELNDEIDVIKQYIKKIHSPTSVAGLKTWYATNPDKSLEYVESLLENKDLDNSLGKNLVGILTQIIWMDDHISDNLNLFLNSSNAQIRKIGLSRVSGDADVSTFPALYDFMQKKFTNRDHNEKYAALVSLAKVLKQKTGKVPFKVPAKKIFDKDPNTYLKEYNEWVERDGDRLRKEWKTVTLKD